MTDEPRRTEYQASTYGDAFADVYDDWYSGMSDVDTTIEVLEELAAGSHILELGVGTGRLAIVLAAKGATVTGVDSSAAMLTKLAINDPDQTVMATLADMAELSFVREFGLAFVAFNTLFNLADSTEQLACFRGVANALKAGGLFVVEAIVPDLEAEGDDRGITPTALDYGGVVLNVTIADKAAQVVTGQHIEIATNGDVTLRPWRIHYCSVAELDSMATSVGFVLESRWENWSKDIFTDDSTRHVSIYRLTP